MNKEMMNGKVRVVVLAESGDITRVAPVDSDDYILRAYWVRTANLTPIKVKVSKTKKGGNSGTTQHQAQ